MYAQHTMKVRAFAPGLEVYATFKEEVYNDGEVKDWDVQEVYLETFGEHKNLLADFPYPPDAPKLEWLAKVHPKIESLVLECYENGVEVEKSVRAAA